MPSSKLKFNYEVVIMAEHSKLLSPSASAVWLECTASPQAIIDAGLQGQSSADADRGTLMHHYAEQMFLGNLDPKGAIPDGLDQGDWDEVFTAVKAAKYVLRDCSDKTTIFTEKKVSQGGWRTDCFGTVDILAYDPEQKALYVIDYKFGRVRVEVTYNSQLMIYSLAAIEELFQEASRVVMAIVQPKISHEAPIFSIQVPTLMDWDVKKLAPKQAAIISGKTCFTVGEHCGAKYCKLERAGKCKVLNGEMDNLMDEYMVDENTPRSIPSRENLPFFFKLMKYEPALTQLQKTAWAVATEMALDGEEVPGFKIVEGKGKRSWKDEKEAEEFLRKKGVRKEDRYKQSLITAPQAETLLKRTEKLDSAKAIEAFKEQVEWVAGSKILVPESDPRDAVLFASVDDIIDDLFDLNPKEESIDDFVDSLFSDEPDFIDNLLNDI